MIPETKTTVKILRSGMNGMYNSNRPIASERTIAYQSSERLLPIAILVINEVTILSGINFLCAKSMSMQGTQIIRFINP